MKEELMNIQEELNTEADKYLTFSIGEEVFGLDIKYVDDIIGVQEITKVPQQPVYLQGVINLRGIIIPVIDFRLRLGKPFREYDDRTCVIVVNVDDASIGIVVDTVLEVLNLKEEEIAEPPRFEEDGGKEYMKGIGKHNDEVVIIIHCEELVREE